MFTALVNSLNDQDDSVCAGGGVGSKCWVVLMRLNRIGVFAQAFVVYEDIFDAKQACDHLSGFNIGGRYLVVLYYQANKVCPLS